MRILHILSAFPRHADDAIVPWLVRLMDELELLGIHSEAYVPAYQGGGNTSFHGHPVHRFRYAWPAAEILTHEERAIERMKKGKLFKLLPLFYVVGGLLGLFVLYWKNRRQNIKYDLVHVHWPLPHWVFGWLACRLFKAPSAVSCYEAEFKLAERTPGGVAIMRHAIKNATLLAANSTWTAKRIAHVWPRAAHVMPFAMGLLPQSLSAEDLMLQYQSREQRRQQNANRRLLFVGNLIERKGVDVLIQAMQHLPSHFTLTVIGDGPCRPSWHALSDRLVPGRVSLAGRVSHQELTDIYLASDYFVLPAKADSEGEVEGQGVVLLEAMTAGLPCVASASGGIVDIIRPDDTGLSVPPGDPESLAQAILRIDQDSSLREHCVVSGARMVREEYDWPTLAKSWRVLYQQTTNSL